MNNDLDMEARPDPFARSAGNQGAGRLDWLGLRARLTAAHDAVLLASPRNSALSGGSFDRVSARALAVYGIRPGREQGGVNPTVLGIGNSRYGKDAAVAGANSAGDRG